MIWFTSDTHFGHERIIEVARTQYASTAQMDDAMVRTWNHHVRDGDTVYHLGDFALTHPDDAFAIRRRLNGNILLIAGNHESCAYSMQKQATKSDDLSAFGWIKDYYHFSVPMADEKWHFCLLHYPMVSWQKQNYGSVHLHGHCHGNLSQSHPRRRDVGWDVWGRPVSVLEIVSEVRSEYPLTYDHHEVK